MPEQLAARVELQVDDGAVVEAELDGPSSVLVPWPFASLASRQRLRWRVQVRSGAGWTDVSPWADAEVGLLEPSDWVSRPIGLRDDGRGFGPRGGRGAVYLRRRFEVSPHVARARLYATALGIYELHIDGTRVGDLELTPGFTAYRSSLEVQTYDVTDLLPPGDHELVATLTDGWFRGSVGFTREEFAFGEQLALLAQLEVEGPDGGVVIGTDTTWETAAGGPIVAADLIEGERVDLRRPFPPEGPWTPAVRVELPSGTALVSSPGPPTRAVETYEPVSVRRLDDERQVVDLGANINGRLRMAPSGLGPAGTTVRLTHGEQLDPDGDVDMGHLEVRDFMTGEPLGHGQVDEVVSAGPHGPGFEPRHTTHGFRYVRVEGAPNLRLTDVTGVMVHTDLVRTGWFTCSDPRLDALHEAAVLSFRGNACEIPTDCPQRERAGWTGDWQVFVPSAAFLYDVAGFTDRWLRDLAADQWPDGRVTNHVPDPIGPAGQTHPMATFVTGSSGWGDAAVLVPLEVWRAYGDTELLARQYPSMVAWVEFALGVAASQRHPRRAAERPEPMAHEQHLWDSGFHWGEWCEPGPGIDVFSGEVEQGHVATAYLARSLDGLALAAEVLDRPTDADRWVGLADQARAAWRAEYVGADGHIVPRTQANVCRALAFGLVALSERSAVLQQLVDLVEEAGWHVGTGFLTTPFLLPTLADEGRPDVAYRLLLQDSAPSWLAMIDAGATTIWEDWEGADPSHPASLNHYSKGAVVSFLHRYVAGIRMVEGEPAYRRFVVEPVPGGDLTHAEAVLDTPYGRVRSAWRRKDDMLEQEVTVPPGTRARAVLSDRAPLDLGPGAHRFRSAASQPPG